MADSALTTNPAGAPVLTPLAAPDWADLLYVSDASVASGIARSKSLTIEALFTAATLTVNKPLLKNTSYSLTGADATSALHVEGTWNTSGAPSLVKAYVINTASSANSLLLDLGTEASVGAFTTPILQLRVDGRLTLTGRISATTTSALGHAHNVSDTNTAAAALVASIGHTLSAGSGANGIGAHFDWNIDSSTTVLTRAARWTTVWTDATHATRSATTTFNAFVSGTETPQLVIGGNQIAGPVGTAAAPSFANRNALGYGLYFPTNAVGLSSNGSAALTIGSTGLVSVGPSLTPSANLDVNNGTTPTKAYFYDAVTAAASPTDYSRFAINTAASGTAYTLRTEAGGTGLTAGKPRVLQVGPGPSSGTNIAGQDVIWHSGPGTGTGVGGTHLFQASVAGSSGVGVNTLTTVAAINSAGNLTLTGTGGSLFLGSTGALFWGSGSRLASPSDGVLQLLDTATTSFNRLQFGGTTSSFPALKRSSAQLHCRLADDSADAVFQALQLNVAGTKVVGVQGALVADASGGAVIDAEARTALNALLARVRTHGLIAT